ncbi:hypothetical protein Trydic_g8340 [Trypoxylus dichotomus]
MAYLDDLLIPATTIEKGLSHIKEALEIIREAGLTLNPQRCHFLLDEIQYLGFNVSGKGIKPSSAKIICIESFPRPSSVHNIRQFLGLTSYFRRFVQDYASKVKPLTTLLRQNIT